uniref:Cytochrome b-c1 complex subunit 9 n=1 Tax=Timema californicum TaxID=61474 RepID=A0A7R9PAE6_TIMCA|nr:unnamed protein product [Timema californicum]
MARISSIVYNALFKRTSTFAATIIVGAFFFERSFELGSNYIYDSINKGMKLLAHCKCIYSSPMTSLVLTDSSQLTSESQHLAISCELSVSTKEVMGLLYQSEITAGHTRPPELISLPPSVTSYWPPSQQPWQAGNVNTEYIFVQHY